MVRKIPVSAAEKITIDDKKNGIRYFIKPRTGRIDMKFTAIVELINNVSIMDKIDAVCDIVDLFLCGAESTDKYVKFPQIPAGIKYTDVLDSDSIIFVYNEIMRSFGLFVEEKKSSSQQQTSSSEMSNTGISTTAMDANMVTGNDLDVRA